MSPTHEPPKGTRTERLAKALLDDANKRDDESSQRAGFFDRCFACGIVLGKYRDGRFCSPKHRAAYDNGAPAWARGETQTRIVYRWRDGTPIQSTATGFLIRCAGCDKEFNSKGLRFCSSECERKRSERERNRATMAEVGIEPAEKRRCLECGTIIPKWTKGKRTPSSKRFCSDKCSARHRRRFAAGVAEDD